jgi:DNA-binding transcriptional regulator YiaG
MSSEINTEITLRITLVPYDGTTLEWSRDRFLENLEYRVNEYLDPKCQVKGAKEIQSETDVIFDIVFSLDKKWASTFTIPQMVTYIRNLLNSSVGFIRLIKNIQIESSVASEANSKEGHDESALGLLSGLGEEQTTITPTEDLEALGLSARACKILRGVGVSTRSQLISLWEHGNPHGNTQIIFELDVEDLHLASKIIHNYHETSHIEQMHAESALTSAHERGSQPRVEGEATSRHGITLPDSEKSPQEDLSLNDMKRRQEAFDDSNNIESAKRFEGTKETKVNVQALRDEFGLTRWGLARKLGVNHMTVRNWELGQSSPNERNSKALLSLARLQRVERKKIHEIHGEQTKQKDVYILGILDKIDLTPRKLANKLGVRTPTIAAWKQGRTPSERNLKALLSLARRHRKKRRKAIMLEESQNGTTQFSSSFIEELKGIVAISFLPNELMS